MVSRRTRTDAEEVAAAHARLAAIGFDAAGPVTGGWVPEPPAGDVPAPDDTAPVGLRTRLAVAPPGVVALVAVGALAVVVAAALAWHARARPVATAAPPPPAATPAASARAAVGTVVVDVTGKVRRPGLVTLPLGARVADAIRAAGGARPGTDLSTVNLARKLVDGEQIVVGTAPGNAAAGQGSGAAPATAAGGGVVNLNAATVADFDTLPGIGPVLAQRIVDWRTAHGGFTDVSQLRQVSGIGDSKYAQLKDLVRV